MNKSDFMSCIAALYRCANRSDHEARHEHGEDWTVPAMSGVAGCVHLDAMISAMVEAGALTTEDQQAFYDTI